MPECDPKMAAARGAIELLSRMHVDLLGVGTGSTVSRFIGLLRGSPIKPRVVAASSLDSALKLSGAGYQPVHPSTVSRLDAYVDGADEVDPEGRLLKGRGAALLGEKILAAASRVNIFIVTEEKLVEKLGSRRPVPVEVVRDALSLATRLIRERYPGACPRSSNGKDGPVVSDWGGVVVDVPTGPMGDPQEVDMWLHSIPGVVETGIFHGYTDYVVVGRSDCGWDVVRYERPLP